MIKILYLMKRGGSRESFRGMEGNSRIILLLSFLFRSYTQKFSKNLLFLNIVSVLEGGGEIKNNFRFVEVFCSYSQKSTESAISLFFTGGGGELLSRSVRVHK